MDLSAISQYDDFTLRSPQAWCHDQLEQRGLTTPVFLSGWLGTGSAAGAILQLVTVANDLDLGAILDRNGSWVLERRKAEAALNEQATSETINQRVEER